ncbi:tetratricopeptide repeat protein [Paraflavitalea pollutisoli]|uniref:tetratricopeptide repeat protein n=1 Tax=Paraflavitalea pollutisoli TaxID=3034143 RepID=UPI0023EC1A55|nr:tetratricopeptide repeat protein [Paraflavitalea sp. H1-2-19X]
MKKPWLQFSLGVVTLALAFIAFVGSNSRSLSSIADWLTVTSAAYITAICGVLTVTVLVLMRYRALPWTGKNGERLRIKKLNKSIYFVLGLLVCCCWITAIVNAQTARMAVPPAITRNTPPFDRTVKGNKVLILPFRKECEYMGMSYDIGYVIRQRLEAMRLQDSVLIQTRYFIDSIDLRNFTTEMADSLMKITGANQIVYGSYSLAACEGKPSDKICYNYRTDRKSLHMEEDLLDHEYKIFDFYGLEDIRNGAGMETIDYVIYSVSGTAQYWGGKYKSAIALFQKIKDYQHKAAALFGIGNCYMMMRDHQTARSYYQQTLAIKPDYAEALSHYSIIAMRNNQPDSARQLIALAQQANPDNPCVNRILGDISLLDRDTTQAKEAYRRVTRQFQESDQVLISLAKEFFQFKDYADALETLHQAVKVHPSHPGIWNLLGQLYFVLEDDATAIICFDNALAFDRQDVKALHNKGLVHLKNERFREAICCFREATAISPRMHEAWIALADCYRQQQQDELAIDCLQDALSYDPKAENVLACAADLFTRLGRYSEATIHYAALTRLRPSSVGYFSQLAEGYISLNDHASALLCYEKICRLSPRNGEAYYKMAQSQSLLNRPAQTIQSLTVAIGLNPSLLVLAQGDWAFRSLADNKNFSLLVKNYSLVVKSFHETPACHPPLHFPGRITAGISTNNRPTLFRTAHILLPSWQAK